MSNNGPQPATPEPISRWWPLAAAAWILGLAVAMSLDDPRLRYPSYVGAYALAAGGWLGLLRAGRAVPLVPILGAALALRLWAWWLPPAFSEDVFRYVYEGRLVWFLGPAAPFVHPPAAGPELGLPPALLDEAWLRINHPEISTIYPPFAQLVFALTGGASLLGGSALLWLKAALVAADLGTWALLARTLKARGRPVIESLVWGACPLVILEIGREGHADSLSALGLAVGIYGFTAARPKIGYLGLGLAALGKLNGLVVLPAAVRSTRRGLAVAVGLCGLLAVPWLLAGPSAGEGLGQYASRWRAGDGAFTLLLELSGALLGGDWSRVAGITVTRHQLARALTGLCFGAFALVVLRRATSMAAIPARAGTLLLGLLLLAPTLHPWYVTWLLPFCVAAGFTGRRAVLALATLAALLHHPGWLELLDGRWRDLWGLRALVHVPVWGFVLHAAWRARRELAPDAE